MNKIIRCLGLCKEKGCNYYVNMFSKKRNLNKLDIVQIILICFYNRNLRKNKCMID